MGRYKGVGMPRAKKRKADVALPSEESVDMSDQEPEAAPEAASEPTPDPDPEPELPAAAVHSGMPATEPAGRKRGRPADSKVDKTDKAMCKAFDAYETAQGDWSTKLVGYHSTAWWESASVVARNKERMEARAEKLVGFRTAFLERSMEHVDAVYEAGREDGERLCALQLKVERTRGHLAHCHARQALVMARQMTAALKRAQAEIAILETQNAALSRIIDAEHEAEEKKSSHDLAWCDAWLRGESTALVESAESDSEPFDEAKAYAEMVATSRARCGLA